MIITAFLYLVYYAVYAITAVLRLLPDVTVNADFAAAIATASAYIGALDSFLPVGIIITALGVILSVEIIIAVYKIIMWIIRRIPTQS